MFTTPNSPSPGFPDRPRRRRLRSLLLSLLVLSLLAVVGLVVATWLGPGSRLRTAPRPLIPEFTIPFLDVVAGSAVPTAAPPLPASVPGPNDPRQHWINQVSGKTDIPQRVLRAYAHAAALTALRNPACHLSWTMLAGVGRIESDHGQHHGDVVNADGREQWPIVGPALDGSPGVQRIPDTDHGALDGDPVWDHAVGPMQFLPSRWAALGQRASGDGKAPDPQNIDDAALTAARHLCSGRRDLAAPADWWAAAFTYNNSVTYGRQVFSAADAYARAAAARS